MSSRFAAALSYAQMGIPVFPCVVGGKEPATAHGFKDRTTDLTQIERWWSQADYNLAIVPEDAGWCVIDIDPKNGGFDTWNKHFSDRVPQTYTVRTPSGGLHLYFKGSLPGSAGKLGRGIDTRGRDGYVLVPPSIVNGNEYIRL